MDICNSSIQHINDMNNTFIGGVKDTIKTLTVTLTQTIDVLTKENKSVKETNSILIDKVNSLELQLKNLSRELENSQEEQRQLLKVSRVVAIEKDNARLRLELQQLEVKFQLLKESKTITNITQHDTPKETEVGEEITKELYHDEEALNVREKKIKGIVYYLSDDNNVYAKNDDESVGELLGSIDGKKVKWF
jgi:hypothetical protein